MTGKGENFESNNTVNQKELLDILLNVGLVRPVFIWGPPGIGKSAIVEQFAKQVGLPCMSLLGSQLPARTSSVCPKS